MNKLVFPEVVGRVFDELNESDEKSPGMRSVDYQSLQQHSVHTGGWSLYKLTPHINTEDKI